MTSDPHGNEGADLTSPHRPQADLLPNTSAVVSLRSSNASNLNDVPNQIGPYYLLELLGEGGMGTVYLAERREPVRLRVALKIIKFGMDTREVIARFESERQAIALMNHPNIAHVLDAGATSSGRPYFVMEHVSGVPLTNYCDTHRLTNKERLALFSLVCNAVQHAHERGLIHRDLKPSNVLVTIQDGLPMPKIIDFGVAKAINQKLTEKTLFTQNGQIVGTPEYMSPEQAEMSGLDIDTRADVYSLGVILYELLVGSLPFDSKSLRRAGFAEIQRIIREVDPPKPSTRLSSLGKGTGDVANRRRIDAHALQREIRGDLDWITMKAIEKDRTRRYATATALADDVARYLTHQPIVARPPSTPYRLRRFLQRQRTVVLLISTLIAATVTSGGLFYVRRRARLEQADALTLRATTLMRSNDDAAAAPLLRQALDLRPDHFEAILNLATIRRKEFDQSGDPRAADDALGLLDRAATIDKSRTELWNIRGVLLRKTNRLSEAIDSFQRAIELDSGYFPIYISLANAYAMQQNWKKTEETLLRADRLDAVSNDPRPWHRWHNLAAVQLALDTPDAAMAIRKALAVGQSDPNVRLLDARAKLWLAAASNPQEALVSATTAEGTGQSDDPPMIKARRKRLLALAHLRTNHLDEAAAAAQAAIDLHDPVPAYPRLVLALAIAGKEPEIARKQFSAAMDDWPSELEKAPAGISAIVGKDGLLWFETLREIRALRDEARKALR